MAFNGQGWRLVMGLAGVLMFVGGSMHPDPHPELGIFQSLGLMLADASWVPSHSLLLAGTVALLAGLLGMLRSGLPQGRLATLARITTIGLIVGVVEGVLHLAAVLDTSALQAGTATPIFSAHLIMSVIAYPAMGLPLAALAWVGGQSRALTHPALGVIGVIGSLMHSIAAPLVVLSQNQNYSFLFMGAALFAVWLIAIGLGQLLARMRRQPALA